MTEEQSHLLEKVFAHKGFVLPIRVKIEQMPTGTSIIFTDAKDIAIKCWAYQGEKSIP